MSYQSIPKVKVYSGKILMKTVVAVILLFIFAGCSNHDDYEIFAKIQGLVTDYQTGAPIANAIVTLSPTGLSKQTDAKGFYQFEELDAQQFTITVQKSGYQPNRKTITAISGETQQADLQLKTIPQE